MSSSSFLWSSFSVSSRVFCVVARTVWKDKAKEEVAMGERGVVEEKYYLKRIRNNLGLP